MEKQTLYIELRPTVTDADLEEGDLNLDGVYEVDVPALLSDEEAASLAIATLHRHVAIAQVRDFDITVLNGENVVLEPLKQTGGLDPAACWSADWRGRTEDLPAQVMP